MPTRITNCADTTCGKIIGCEKSGFDYYWLEVKLKHSIVMSAELECIPVNRSSIILGQSATYGDEWSCTAPVQNINHSNSFYRTK